MSCGLSVFLAGFEKDRLDEIMRDSNMSLSCAQNLGL